MEHSTARGLLRAGTRQHANPPAKLQRKPYKAEAFRVLTEGINCDSHALRLEPARPNPAMVAPPKVVHLGAR